MSEITAIENAPPRCADDVTDIDSLPRGTSSAAVHESLCRNGAVISIDLLEPHTVKQINAELDPILNGPRLGHEGDYLGNTRRINSTLRHAPTVATEVVPLPALTDVAGAVLLEHCCNLQLSVAHVAEIGPGEPAQFLHRDDRTFGLLKGRVHPLSVVTIIALTTFEVEYGATRVIPGSHLWDDAYEPTVQRYAPGSYDDLEVPALLKPGSALTFLGTTLHGAGANTSNNVQRRALIINYIVGWLRGEANNFLLYPPEFARTLPEKTQRLLGYHIEAQNLGELEIGEDPITLLR